MADIPCTYNQEMICSESGDSYRQGKERKTYMELTEKEVLFTRKASAWFKGLAIIMVILSHYAEWWSWFYVEEGISETIRYAVSRFGPYGVAIFLLFSGYGLAKSAGHKRIDSKFILKRVLNVYIPYLAIVILIEMLSGGFETQEDVIDILYGGDFWYMTVMFSFYIAFIIIGLLFVNCHIRALLNTIFAITYSQWLYGAGEQDFWYISNIAFAIGVLLALYEPFMKKVMDKVGIVFMFLFGIGSAYAVRFALFVEHAWGDPVDEIWARIIAVLTFTLFVTSVASVWKWYDSVIGFLGKNSLYLYLSHTFVFMWAINYFEYEMWVRFLIATIMILVISVILGVIISKLTNRIYTKLSVYSKNKEEFG